MAIVAPPHTYKSTPSGLFLHLSGRSPITVTPAVASVLTRTAAAAGVASISELTEAQIQDALTKPVRNAPRREPCTIEGCSEQGREHHFRGARPHHSAAYCNRDDYSIALHKDGDDPWTVRLYVDRNGTDLTLATLTALADDLTQATTRATSLNSRADACGR